jgi:hypothetical protein
MTNQQVIHIVRYQLARADSKATDDLDDDQGKLLRTAARAFPQLADTSLTASEKKALGDFSDDELKGEEKKRAEEKPGLTGKARFQWVVQGMDGKAQQEAARKASALLQGKEPGRKRESAPKDPSGQRMRRLSDTDGRWAESAFEKFAVSTEGVIVFAVTDREKGTATLVGQLPPAPAFYTHIKPALQAKGLDPEKVDLVTISARFGYTNRPVAAEERFRPPTIGIDSPVTKAEEAAVVAA